jgi:hypothetical protein
VCAAAPPRASTIPTWRSPAPESFASNEASVSRALLPCAIIASPSGPKLILHMACVATAPAPACAQLTTAPTAGNLLATATPHDCSFGS